MAGIDTLKALARNGLKKTGDAMIAGFLTLFQDPTLPLHAATKNYVDTHSSAAAPALSKYISNGWYGPTWVGYNSQVVEAGGANLFTAQGVGRMGIFVNDASKTFKTVSLNVNTLAPTWTARLGIYTVDPTTFLPTAIEKDLGTIAVNGTATGYSSTISPAFSSTSSILGLVVFIDTVLTGTPNPQVLPLNLQHYHPLGAPFASSVALNRVIVGCSGQPSGALPAPGTFSAITFDPNTLTRGEPLVRLQVS